MIINLKMYDPKACGSSDELGCSHIQSTCVAPNHVARWPCMCFAPSLARPAWRQDEDRARG